MKRKYNSILAAVTASTWAILPEKLDQIAALLSLRASGGRLTKAEVRSRIGPPRKQPDQAQGQVALLNVFGVLSQRVDLMAETSGGTSTERVQLAFRDAMNNQAVKAIVLNIDSPGGRVEGVQELAETIYQHRGTKPVIGIANSGAHSGGYWILAACDEVVAAPSASVGSVGVYTIHIDDTAALEQAGITKTVIRAGKHKAAHELPLDEATQAKVQAVIDERYAIFIAALAKYRGVTEAKVKSSFGEGLSLLAPAALAAGMIDRIATLEEVLQGFGVGSAAAASTPPAGPPAFSLSGVLDMNARVFAALVSIGMITLTSDEAAATSALDRFFAVKGLTTPDKAEDQLAALQGHLTASKAAPPTAPTPAAPIAGLAANDRAEQILAACKIASLADDRRFALYSELVSAKDAAGQPINVKEALDRIQTEAAAASKPTGATILPGAAQRDKFQVEARTALLSRAFNGQIPTRIYDQQARDYVEYKPAAGHNYGLANPLRLAEACLAHDGFSQQTLSRLAPFELAQLALGVVSPHSLGVRAEGPAYNTSGMFANLLLDAANVRLRSSYDDGRTTFQVWAKKGESLADFKAVNKVIGGELGDPKVVPEDGEFEETTLTDGKESYKLTVWGHIFSITWQAVVNDRLNAIWAEILPKEGRAFKRKQNRLAYGVLKDNAALADTGNLFNATAIATAGGHNNLATGAGAPSVATLNTLTTKMMEQKGLSSESAALNIMPRYLLAPPAMRGTVLELMGSTSNPAASNANTKNIWENGLEPVIDAELGTAGGGLDTSWYLAADSSEVDTVEYAYLQGLESPRVDQMASFERLAVRQRVYLAFAVKALDFRGLQKHAGA